MVGHPFHERMKVDVAPPARERQLLFGRNVLTPDRDDEIVQ